MTYKVTLSIGGKNGKSQDNISLCSRVNYLNVKLLSVAHQHHGEHELIIIELLWMIDRERDRERELGREESDW